MKRLTSLLVVVLLISSAGCSNGATPAPDPFFGRVTISPPSTQMGTGGSSYASSPAASSYTPRAVVAAPVSPSNDGAVFDSPWPSPPPPNLRSGSTNPSAPGSIASTAQPTRSQPTRPIYLSQSAIEDSVRQPSYHIAPTNPRYGGSVPRTSSAPIAAAGSGRATTSVPSSPRQIYPAPNAQATNSPPVRVQSNISYHSADGSIPQYGDPRSSFGLSPRARFRQSASASEAPPWSPGQANTGSGSGQLNAPPFGATQPNMAPANLTQPRVTPGTLASGDDLEKLLPPIRGYTNSGRTTRAQSGTARSSTARRSYSRSSLASTRTSPPPGFPTPSKVVNIADLPSASYIATRPSDSRNSGRTRRLSYEAPATDSDRQDASPSTHRDVQVQPISFTSPVLYSHEADYSRLRGELDFSESDQRWKLRYISISAEKSDNYGGSVIFSDPSKLSGFERGDFIEVHGRILSGPQNDCGYAPCYEILDIKRVR